MQEKLYIPEKLKVGFQKRQGTYSGKLAYVIYYGPDGKLRKEKSWEGWRDSNIEPIEIDNTPHSGFILNKSVERCNWEWYSSGRSYIRVYDDRGDGIEFEITPTNLLFILMNTNCVKRELEGEFVYAWYGKDLLLLPTCTPEYEASINFTQLQSKKVGVADMIPGCVYQTKRDGNLIYLGKYTWTESHYRRGISSTKKYIFINESADNNTPWFITKSDLNSLAMRVSDEPVSQYAQLLDRLKEDNHTCTVESVKFIPLSPVALPENYSSTLYKRVSENEFIKFSVHKKHDYWYGNRYKDTGLYFVREESNIVFSRGKLTYKAASQHSTYEWTKEMITSNLGKLKVKLSNGREVDFNDYI